MQIFCNAFLTQKRKGAKRQMIKLNSFLSDFASFRLCPKILQTRFIFYIAAFFFLSSSLPVDATLYLRDHLRKAQKGDYVVTAQGKNVTLLHVLSHSEGEMVIEEVTVPESYAPPPGYWKGWIAKGAAQNTSWTVYSLDDQKGEMKELYSLSQQCWLNRSQKDNLFTKLLSIPFEKMPQNRRKRRGVISSNHTNPWWQPKMIFEGHEVRNITFDAWWTRWPNDGSDLAGREITIYLLANDENYPNYFPYWLQAKGSITKGQMRIIDSGKGMSSSTGEQFFKLPR